MPVDALPPDQEGGGGGRQGGSIQLDGEVALLGGEMRLNGEMELVAVGDNQLSVQTAAAREGGGGRVVAFVCDSKQRLDGKLVLKAADDQPGAISLYA